MRRLSSVLIAFALALALGLGATWWTVANGLAVGGLTIGPWKASPSIGALGADPYLRARIARSGEAPLAYGDGLSFTAVADDGGRRLELSCDYSLEGQLPTARLWTLAVFTIDGRRLRTALGRSVTSSEETVRTVGAPLAIVLSRHARAGDWLQLAGDGPFVLRLTLYDTALGTPLARSNPQALLDIRRGVCR